VANPEQGPTEQGIVGTWQTISLEVPDFLEPVREAIDAFFNFLIQILSILIGVLEILKVFLSGLLDPLIAIINAIKNLIESLLNDLRQAGIYIHGDFYSLQGPDFQALRGGYLSYEARMIARLQDSSDPNRPNISQNSTVIAVLLFAQADIRGINRIIRLIKSILRLFNRQYPVPRLQPRPTNIQASYGYDGATVFSFSKSFFKGFRRVQTEGVDDNINSPFNAVNLTWEMSGFQNTFPDTPIIPPAGFLVEFSTFRQPLKVVCERPIPGTLEKMEMANQPSKREVVDVLDQEGNPLGLTAGADEIDLQSTLDWNNATSFSGETKPDAVRVYGIKNLSDVAPVQLGDLEQGGKHYLQKAFFVPFSQNLFFPGKGYGATFKFDDMPFDADWEIGRFTKRLTRVNDSRQPEKFFVRVRAVSNTIKSTTDYQYILDQTSMRDTEGPKVPIKGEPTIEMNDRGPSSDVTEILFPDASTELYLRAVAEALAIVVLSRSDIPVLPGKSSPLPFLFDPANVPLGVGADGLIEPFWGGYEDHARLATGLEEIAKFMTVQLTGRRFVKKYFAQADADLTKFRKKLFVNCINLTNRFFTQNTPPLAARQLAVERAEDLLNFRILFLPTGASGLSTIEATIDPETAEDAEGGSLMELLQGQGTLRGVSPNPSSLGIVGGRAADLLQVSLRSNSILPRNPHFFFARQQEGDAGNDIGRGSVDQSPVIFARSGNQLDDIQYVRNLIPDSVYEGALFVLQTAVGPQVRPQERGWIAFRLFPQGIPSIDRFFDYILNLLESIAAAIESIAETIRRYIEYLQSRLTELQAFLNRINALIQQLLRFFFAISPAAGLVLVAPGTDGVITGLVGSENKPITPAAPELDSYGGGVILLAGGIPNIVLDVFAALFKGDT
jgi:hypothetical protein